MFDIKALQTTEFSWQAALSLAHASKVAYEPAKTARKLVTQKWGFTDFQFLDVESTQGFIAASDQTLLIAFRGTTDVADWLSNMDIATTVLPYGMVHAGFHRCYSLSQVQVHAEIEKAANAGKRIWLTGHSLGGALAVVTAMESVSSQIAGLYTFGQPRAGDSLFRDSANKKLVGRYFRFVNDEDLVTRVPPGFRHAGSLIHFDGHGNLATSFPGAEFEAIEATDPPSLSDQEFKHLQQQLRELRSASSPEESQGLEGMFSSTLSALFPSIADHNLDDYMALIRRQLPSNTFDAAIAVTSLATAWTKPSMIGLESVGVEVEAAPSKGGSSLKVGPVPVLLRLRDAKWSPPADLTVNSHFGNFVSAQTTRAGLNQLKDDPNVISIEASREAGFEELAASIPFVGGDVIHRPPITEKGGHALIGIVDSGIDVFHEAFRDADGKTRILGIWHQRDAGGPSPSQIDPKFTQQYGALYTKADINQMLEGAKEVPEALRDPARHGTHVASIAAGRACGQLPDGMAPEAKIVLVIPHMKTAPNEPPSLGYSSSHVDALIFLKLVSRGDNALLTQTLPIAVNVSLGMNAGAHDGSSTLEDAFDSIGERGYVIVKSAGNERGNGGHTREQAQEGALRTVKWRSQGIRPQDYVEAWYSSHDELEFVLADPAQNQSARVSNLARDFDGGLGGNHCRMHLEERCPDNGESRLIIVITPADAQIQPGEWSLAIFGKAVYSEGFVDLWAERYGISPPPVQFQRDVDDTTLTIPGTADSVIAVAACNAMLPLELTASSSFGLTRDRRAKPDVCAPGVQVVAAASSTDDHQATIAMTGTSMAAPHVTGALALALSHRHKSGREQFNAQQLRAALTRTVKNFNGRHNQGSGYGPMDALAFFNKLSA